MSLFQAFRGIIHRGHQPQQRPPGRSPGRGWIHRPAIESLEDRWLLNGSPTQVQDLFVIGLDSQVWAEKLDTAGNPAASYFLTQPMVVKSFSAGHDAAGRPELFVIGSDDQVYGLHFDANGDPVGGYVLAAAGQVKTLTIGHDASNRPEAFVIGLDDQVYALHFDANGNPAGSYFLTQPGQVEALAPGQDASNRPEVFVLGLDDQVWAQQLDANGNPVGSYFLTQPGLVKSVTAGHDASGNPEVFVTGLDDQVWAQNLDANGNPAGSYFLTQPGQIKSLSLGYDAGGRPEVFVIGLDDQVWAQQLDAAGQSLGAYSLTAEGAVTALGVYSDPTVYVLGLDGQVYLINTDQNSVRTWRPLAPGQVITMQPPNAVGTSIPLKDQARPIEAISPTALDFMATLGGPNPSAQTLTVQNTERTYRPLFSRTTRATDALNYTMMWSANWLAVGNPAKLLPAGAANSHSVSVNISGLAAGTYSAAITIAGNAANSPQVVPVTLTIIAPVPAITVTPPALNVNADQGSGNLAPQMLKVQNTGAAGSMLQYTLATDASWLKVPDTMGTLAAGQMKAHQVVINISGLVPAIYHATITITGNASNNPLTVPVTLTIVAPQRNPFDGSYNGNFDGFIRDPLGTRPTNGGLQFTVASGNVTGNAEGQAIHDGHVDSAGNITFVAGGGQSSVAITFTGTITPSASGKATTQGTFKGSYNGGQGMVSGNWNATES